MSGYVKTFKVKDEINKLMSSLIDSEKILEKHKAIIKIENLKNIELNALPVYDDRYIKTYGDKVYTNFCSLNVPEGDTKYESFSHFY